MAPVRQVVCTKCHWSLWTEAVDDYEKNDARCPRCGAGVVVGKRPDDYYPTHGPGRRSGTDSDPAIAILHTQPSRTDDLRSS